MLPHDWADVLNRIGLILGFRLVLVRCTGVYRGTTFEGVGGGLRIRVAQPFNRVEHGICVGHLWTHSLFRLLGCAGRPILSKAAALFFLGNSSRRSALRKFVFGQAPQVSIGLSE